MERVKKIIAWLISAIFIVVTLTILVYANSAEPPGLTVVVYLPPDDLTIAVRFADGSITDAVQLQKEQKAWEVYYRFFYDGMSSKLSLDGSTLIVSSSKKSFEISLSTETFGLYNNLITLDFKNESISNGQTPFRSFLLISIRVILTLAIEGLILFMFKYRKKSSWAIFIIVNLLTQTGLNIILSGVNLSSYWIYGLVFLEVIIYTTAL